MSFQFSHVSPTNLYKVTGPFAGVFAGAFAGPLLRCESICGSFHETICVSFVAREDIGKHIIVFFVQDHFLLPISKFFCLTKLFADMMKVNIFSKPLKGK